MLRAVSRVPSEAGKRTRWETVCDCGETKIVRLDELKSHYVLSCGCGKNLNFILVNPAEMLRWYKDNAKQRGLSWEISDLQFSKLILGSCHFCGYEIPELGSSIQKFAFNGIDRLNNALGYAITNVVSCCKTCNHAKHVMSENDFMVWMKRIIQYQLQKQTSRNPIEQRSAASGS